MPRFSQFPNTRYMGSKRKLLPSLANIFKQIDFTTALDGFSGSASVSYLLKTLGKKVTTNDYLQFNYHIARALIENQKTKLNLSDLSRKNTIDRAPKKQFITETFTDLYFSKEECLWLDQTIWRIQGLPNKYKRSLAIAAICRACIKKRPRGIFTYTGMRYDDGRKDLQKSLSQHFEEAIEMFNACIFTGKFKARSVQNDIFDVKNPTFDLVYLDPPYLSQKSDNEYSRRYHFLEGLASNWQDVTIDYKTKTKKIHRPHSSFNSKIKVQDTFEKLFDKFHNSIITLSYSSNAIPDADRLTALLRNAGKVVEVISIDHTYSIGTHGHKKNNPTNQVKEFLFIGL